MNRTRISVAILLLCSAATSWGQSRLEAIAEGWKPAGMRPLRVTAVRASSTLMGADGPYAPARAVDGNPHTKWVGEVAASPQNPQWIELELPSPQKVTALALAGEAVGRDGFGAGAIQVAGDGPGSFRTVAEISKAPSARWLVTFEPVKTSKVRLLVTQSGGQSSHTDLLEIQLFGLPLSEAELRQQAIEGLAACRQAVQEDEAAAKRVAAQLDPRLTGSDRQVNLVARQLAEAARQVERWDSLSPSDRTALAERIEQTEIRAKQSIARLAGLPGVWPARLESLRAVRDSSKAPGKDAKIASRREGSRVHMFNGRVAVDLDEADGAWNATWLGGVEAAVRRVRFAVEAGGQRFSPEKVAAEISPVRDALGPGLQIRQKWGDAVRIEREVRIYEDNSAVVISGRVVNRSGRDLPLAAAHMFDLSSQDHGWWYAGQALGTPGVVMAEGLASLGCEPEGTLEAAADAERSYSGTGLLALAHQDPPGSLLVGYLTARGARPDLAARFRPGEAGTAMSANLPFAGRILPPNSTLELDSVYVAASNNPYQSLERYGDAVAAASPLPIRKGPTALWCSWYAHRMGMTEDLVLANAAVAAKHFGPLGLEIMQLDHGWQQGDITGDWIANERFPHGLKWLSQQLQSRYRLKLGVWISPTDVAETSDTFRQHPQWMLRGADGKPAPNWRWYWKPNPMCYELDASHPEAEKWIAETFARLSSEGVSYYKIDFIAAAAGEHFQQYDPQCARGWGVLVRAMDALRRGAGEKAWIRYTQTPYLLTLGLGDSGIAGSDTLDAGLAGNIDVLRTNARSLAAGYWINDRLYHRELCDLSVRMHADVEEVRLRLAMMGLAGCSVSYSDELQYLPPSRIHMMQQCLPPGGPTMRPVDLYERSIPSIWHIPCKTPLDTWDVVGLFNFEGQPEERTLEFARLGLPEKTDVIAFEFWEEKLLGICQDRLTLVLPPGSSRILMLRRACGRPQVVGTDMHLLGGVHEIKKLQWNGTSNVLSGQCRRMPGATGRVYLYVPGAYRPHFDFPLAAASAQLTNVGRGLWMKELQFEGAEISWTIPFDGPAEKKETKPVREPVTTN